MLHRENIFSSYIVIQVTMWDPWMQGRGEGGPTPSEKYLSKHIVIMSSFNGCYLSEGSRSLGRFASLPDITNSDLENKKEMGPMADT